MNKRKRPPTFRRAVLLMTATSFLVPLAGLVTAPILARALGVDGRGELAAALATSALLLGAATLGLPDALTYHVAKRPSMTRRALLWTSLITSALGVACSAVTWLALPFLSGGNEELADLIMLATVLTIPALVVGVFRGAAIGRQMWWTVSIERILMSGLRVALFSWFWLTGILTVYTGVLISVALPVVCGLVYISLLRKPPHDQDQHDDPRVFAPLLGFGSRIWLGSVASMLLSRASQLLMVPLSTTADLGLFIVANTVSDLPLIVALAIQGALFGVNSRTTDTNQVTSTSRLTMLAGFIGCVIMGASLPFWIEILFGAEFRGAIVPTIMLLGSAVLCIPGLMASTGLSAWGRPGLRSLGLAITLVVNVAALMVFVPLWGVYGACWASILANVVLTSFNVSVASKVMGVPKRDFMLIRPSDAVRGWNEITRLVSRNR